MEVEMEMPGEEELMLLESETHSKSQIETPSPSPRQEEAAIPIPVVDLNPVNPRSSSSKRLRQDEDEDEDEEEEWLRYSPKTKTNCVNPPNPISVSRFASDIQGDCTPVTGPHGHRVYAKLNSQQSPFYLSTPTPGAGLLPQSIHVLNQRLENKALSKALQESFQSINQTDAKEAAPTETEQLWVHKYAPTSFTHLLSDEHTNREVLLWLKQWDSRVFGSHVRATSDAVLSSLRMHSSVTQSSRFASNRGSFFKHQKTSSLTETSSKSNANANASWGNNCLVNKPPEPKVLLLCGPPGLGKTTLAHVAAKHCGYRVEEVNASDDRSASSMEAKILDLVEMDSVMPDRKPKCLIIDEIDGALGDGKGAVEAILKWVASERRGSSEKRNGDEETQPRKASSKKGHKVAKLSRPIICICNDLYAPALRQLRQVAKVHTFTQPTVGRVVNRLKYICMKEGFRTNSLALSALAECTECDIRSCLNTLQFLHKKQQPLNIADVDSQVIGRKDMSKSAFDVWKEVFHKKKSKRVLKSVDSQVEQGGDNMDHLYSLISSRGEYELTMDGIHENFLRLSYHDPMMHKTSRCLDMLGTSDFLTRYVYRTQQMSILAYQPSIAVSMSRLIAQFEKPNIEWPKSFQRYRTMLLERQETLKSWQRSIPPSISRHLSVELFVQDVASPLLHIITPPNLRTVVLDLLSEREKDELHQLVDTMLCYSVTYKYSKGEPQENPFADASEDCLLALDPPISDFVNFKGYDSQYFALSVAMKQILVHEVEKQRILQESRHKCGDLTEDNSRPAASWPLTTAGPGKNEKKDVIGSLAPEKPPRSKPVSCFFDRFRKESSGSGKNPRSGMHKADTTKRDSRPFLFKYNEGFTNAVKRPVKIRDLLL